MPEVAYAEFVRAKHNFFNLKPQNIAAIPGDLTNNYQFLFDNLQFIQQEYDLLSPSLDESVNQRIEYWLWCYYCADMLEHYYLYYEDDTKTKKYKAAKEEIAKRFNPRYRKTAASINDQSFMAMLWESYHLELKDFFYDTFTHTNNAKAKLGKLNMDRLDYTFFRMTWITAFTLAKDSAFIEKLSKFLGRPIHFDTLIKVLQAPAAVLRVLSVGIFIVRGGINFILALIKTFKPSPQAAAVSKTKRFYAEMWKRHPGFVNDLVWAIVNALTSYSAAFHIAAPIAMWMISGFLVFDAGVFLWLHHVAKKEYLAKKTQLNTELLCFQRKFEETNDRIWHERYVETNTLLKRLEIQWKTDSRTYMFNIITALVVAAGFTAAMLFTPGLFVVASFMLGSFGVAMYKSSGEYTKYVKAGFVLEQARVDAKKDLKPEQQNFQKARNEFFTKLFKTVLIPAVFIAVFAICWEAALVLSALYLGYKLLRSYLDHKKSQVPAPVAEPEAPVEETELYESCPCVPAM